MCELQGRNDPLFHVNNLRLCRFFSVGRPGSIRGRLRRGFWAAGVTPGQTIAESHFVTEICESCKQPKQKLWLRLLQIYRHWGGTIVEMWYWVHQVIYPRRAGPDVLVPRTNIDQRMSSATWICGLLPKDRNLSGTSENVRMNNSPYEYEFKVNILTPASIRNAWGGGGMTFVAHCTHPVSSEAACSLGVWFV